MAENQEMLPVMYCNSVHFSTSLHDFAMILGVNEPPMEQPKAGKQVKPIVRPYTRVVMSPTHFKRFIEVGTGLLEDYEANFGKIPTDKSASKGKSRKAKKTK